MQRTSEYGSDYASTELPYYRTFESQPQTSFGQDQTGLAAAGYAAPARPSYYAPADDLATTMAGEVLAAQDISVLNHRPFGWQAAGLTPPLSPHAGHAGNTTALALGTVQEDDQESVTRPKTPSVFRMADAVSETRRPKKTGRYVAAGVVAFLVVGIAAGVGAGLTLSKRHNAAAAASGLSAAIGVTTTRSSSTSSTSPVSVPVTTTTPFVTTTPSTTTTPSYSSRTRTPTPTTSRSSSSRSSTRPTTPTYTPPTTSPTQPTTTSPDDNPPSDQGSTSPADDGAISEPAGSVTTTPPSVTTTPRATQLYSHRLGPVQLSTSFEGRA